MAESGDRQLFLTCCNPAPATPCPINLIRCKTLLERYQRPQTGAGTRKHDNSYPTEARHSLSASSVSLQSAWQLEEPTPPAPRRAKGPKNPTRRMLILLIGAIQTFCLTAVPW